MLEGINLLEWVYNIILVGIFIFTLEMTKYLRRGEYLRPLKGPVIIDSPGLSAYGVVLTGSLVLAITLIGAMSLEIPVGARLMLLAICLIWPAFLAFEAIQLRGHRLKPLRK
jgi:hypothetical protein